MAIHQKCWCWKFGLAWLVIGGAITSLSFANASTNSALAQITPDTTLGRESSKVTSTGTVDAIDGGATRGTNLFHSFQEFNIGEGRSAYFTNPTGIENILSRVTGGNPSQILGKLGVLGNANLFLINPIGIIFGQNASLDVRGSFVGTTANGIGLTNGEIFSTNPQAPLPSGLLNVNPNALFFNQIKAGAIANRSIADSRGLQVPQGRSLLLVGGDVNLEGGQIFASGGRVELAGVAGGGTVGLNVDNSTLRVNFPENVARADVSLNNGAEVNVRAGGGGSIAVNAQNLNLAGESSLLAGIASGLGTDNSKAGNIEVNATAAIKLNNRSEIANDVLAEANGQGGDVNISVSTLQVEGGAQVGAGTFGAGKAGNLRVDAQDVQLIGKSANSRFPSGLGTSAQRNSTGDAGDLTVKTNTLLVKDGAQVFTGTFGKGNGGNLTVDAVDVQLIDTSTNSLPIGLFARAERNSTGDAGDLTVKTNTLLVKDGAAMSASTWGAGKGGILTVDAKDVQVIGRSADGQFPSALGTAAQSSSTGDAGDLIIRTNTLLVKDGAQVGAGTFGSGKGGNLRIDAKDVQVIGRSADGQFPSALAASTQSNSTGDAGDLIIRTNTLLVRDGAASVRSFGTGSAGNMTVNARSIRLNNNAILTANTQSTKVDPNREQATININSQDLIMSRNSNIRTNATGENVIGGNINIDTDFLIAFENSDISANSANFRGGNVRINTQGIFGTQFQDVASDRTSDITATGASPEFRGTVELNTLDTDPNSGLVELPTVPVDTEVTQTCTPGGSQQQSEFIVTGRGGLPPNPGETLSTDAVQVNLVTLIPKADRPSTPSVSTNSTSSTPTTIVEAQGWAIDANHNVVLTANASTATSHNSWQKTANCKS